MCISDQQFGQMGLWMEDDHVRFSQDPPIGDDHPFFIHSGIQWGKRAALAYFAFFLQVLHFFGKEDALVLLDQKLLAGESLFRTWRTPAPCFSLDKSKNISCGIEKPAEVAEPFPLR